VDGPSVFSTALNCSSPLLSNLPRWRMSAVWFPTYNSGVVSFTIGVARAVPTNMMAAIPASSLILAFISRLLEMWLAELLIAKRSRSSILDSREAFFALTVRQYENTFEQRLLIEFFVPPASRFNHSSSSAKKATISIAAPKNYLQRDDHMKLMAQFTDASHHWRFRRPKDDCCGKCQVLLNRRFTIRQRLMRMRRFGTSGFEYPDSGSQLPLGRLRRKLAAYRRPKPPFRLRED